MKVRLRSTIVLCSFLVSTATTLAGEQASRNPPPAVRPAAPSGRTSKMKKEDSVWIVFQPKPGQDFILYDPKTGNPIFKSTADADHTPPLIETRVPGDAVETALTGGSSIDMRPIFDGLPRKLIGDKVYVGFRTLQEISDGAAGKPGTPSAAASTTLKQYAEVYVPIEDLSAQRLVQLGAAPASTRNKRAVDGAQRFNGILGVSTAPTGAGSSEGTSGLPHTGDHRADWNQPTDPKLFFGSPTCSPKGRDCRVKSGYGPRKRVKTKNGRWSSGFHRAVDVACPTGTPVVATAAGCVKRIMTNRRVGYGLSVILEHGKDDKGKMISSQYSHMEQFAPNTKIPQCFVAGEVLGYVGETGNVTGPHVCYRILSNGKPMNPMEHAALHASNLSLQCSSPEKIAALKEQQQKGLAPIYAYDPAPLSTLPASVRAGNIPRKPGAGGAPLGDSQDGRQLASSPSPVLGNGSSGDESAWDRGGDEEADGHGSPESGHARSGTGETLTRR